MTWIHPTWLMVAVLSMLLLHGGRCTATLSAGDQCRGPRLEEECGDGLACVATSRDSKIAFCRVENPESNSSQCNLKSCPSLWCPPNLQITHKGDCCPSCPPLPVARIISGNTPSTCIEGDRNYTEGETWHRDSCVTCTCEAGQALCSSVQCAPLSCANPIQLPGHCCPMCPSFLLAPSIAFIEPHPASRVCKDNSVVYKDGESWHPDSSNPCKRCFCDEGDILCSYKQCADPGCANPVFLQNTCCPICPDKQLKRSITEQSNGRGINEKGLTLTYDTPHQNFLPEQPTLDSSQCRAANGTMMKSGDTWCPVPGIKVRCENGSKNHSKHCPPRPSCADLIKVTPGSCDCPHCPYTGRNSKENQSMPHLYLSACQAANGTMMKSGDTWCPVPGIKIRCKNGSKIRINHCPPRPSCVNLIKGEPGSCDCPHCPQEYKLIKIVAILEMQYEQYNQNRLTVKRAMVSLVSAANLLLISVESSKYSDTKVHLILSVRSNNHFEGSEEAAIRAVTNEVSWPVTSILQIGSVADIPQANTGAKKRSVRSTNDYSQSTDKSNSFTTAISVTAAIFISVVTVSVIAVLVTRALRQSRLPKTTIV